MPKGVKLWLRQLLPFEEYSTIVWNEQAPFPGIEEVSTYAPKVDTCLGILKAPHQWHQYYAKSCQELGVPYRMFDLFSPDWISHITSSDCKGILCWPGASTSVWKQMYDERLAVINRQLGIPLMPDYEACWLYESKRRMYYWLAANRFPHPKTAIFYRKQDALVFAETAVLPVVLKTDLGSCSKGVEIVRDRHRLKRAVKLLFGKGLRLKNSDSRDTQWGNSLFQEYIPSAREWRMIRIGDSYFGYEKLKVGDFHSGTAKWRYVRPPDYLLDLARDITNRGLFSSMSIDILLNSQGTPFVTELQGMFGMLNDFACQVDGQSGRMVKKDLAWTFEPGDFCRNRMCNIRVITLLSQLNSSQKDK